MFVSKSGLTMVVKREGLMARVALLFKSEIAYSNKVIYISVIIEGIITYHLVPKSGTLEH